MIILDAKTDYSFMRGFGTPEQWLARCKAADITALGIADYCSTWGHTPFKKAFKNSGVKLIYGVQLPVVLQLDKDPRHSLVTLLATDDVKPLYDAVTLAESQMYYRPRLTWKQVREFPGIVILNYVLPQNMRAAAATNGYLGLSPQMPDHMKRLDHSRVPAYGPRFPSADLRQGYGLVQSISEGTRFGEVEIDALHALRRGELARVIPEAGYKELAALTEIAALCTADIPKGQLIVPHERKDKLGDLRAMAMEGASRLCLLINGGDGLAPRLPPEYHARLERELGVIHEKNFEDYFFFVADVVAWAGQRMFVGPGRGSSGGSLLCYLLGITTVDPLKFGTMFERFIDITRPDLPDIDTDFPDTRREEVFQYLKDTYGSERVARLGTISEFGGKSAINDTAKAFGIPADVGRALGKFTEGAGQGNTISPARVFGKEEDPSSGLLDDAGRALLAQYPDIRLATVIDGHPRHHGVHAAGVVVTNGPVTQHGSLTKEGVIHMDMRAAEDLGLVKMDVLGLKTLSVIQEACDLAGINPRTLYDLTWDDVQVFDKVFNADRVTGIFQFDGDAVRGLMRGIKVERFDDICALASLARPGPLIGGAAGTWVKVRRGDEEPRQLHKSLDSTFGVICYQEQFMQILRDLAGFDEPSVNGARRAVGKKDPEKLRSYREQFVKGAFKYFLAEQPVKTRPFVDNGIAQVELLPPDEDAAREKANALWDEICEFGSYSFNLAHAVEYAMISYMTAWLKTYHPLEFACASLRHAPDDETGKNLLRELSEEGYDYVPFDPERSLETWSIIDKKLFGGFDSVRGVGTKTAQTLLAARRANPTDWLERLTDAQRTKILKEGATPWHDLTYFGTHYADLYRDPANYRSPSLTKGAKPPVLKIKDIPAKKGEYAFLGRITTRSRRDANDPTKVAGRGGKVYATNNWFINLKIEDDTGEIGATINRFKAPEFEWLLEGDKGDLFFRGNIINEGDRKWIFIEKVLEVKPHGKQERPIPGGVAGSGSSADLSDGASGAGDGGSGTSDDAICTAPEVEGSGDVPRPDVHRKKQRRKRLPASNPKQPKQVRKK